MSRTLVIGDIHGGLKALIQILDRVNVTPSDTLIFLGDYVDGWSETSPLLDFLIDLKQKHTCIFMIGNHDLWHLDWLKDGTTNESWIANGGKATIDSYINSDPERKMKHLAFLESMNGYHIDAHNRLYVHDKNLETTSPYFPTRFKLYHEIFIGHSATTKYNIHEPMNIFNIWNIDTGAGFSGKLTIMDADTKNYWQSDFTKELYPNEGGRSH